MQNIQNVLVVTHPCYYVTAIVQNVVKENIVNVVLYQ